MQKFTLAALALVSLTACGTKTNTPAPPPEVSLDVVTDSKVQNVLTINVTVTGEGVREVTLTRENPGGDHQAPQLLKKVTVAPHSVSRSTTRFPVMELTGMRWRRSAVVTVPKRNAR